MVEFESSLSFMIFDRVELKLGSVSIWITPLGKKQDERKVESMPKPLLLLGGLKKISVRVSRSHGLTQTPNPSNNVKKNGNKKDEEKTRFTYFTF